jgi:hypothetical protein
MASAEWADRADGGNFEEGTESGVEEAGRKRGKERAGECGRVDGFNSDSDKSAVG